jgi:hypothetical protein
MPGGGAIRLNRREANIRKFRKLLIDVCVSREMDDLRKVKLVFIFSPSQIFRTYRVVLASRSDIRINHSGLKAESLGPSIGVSVQLGVEQAQSRAFRANVYGESKADVGLDTEVAVYRFRLSIKINS